MLTVQFNYQTDKGYTELLHNCCRTIAGKDHDLKKIYATPGSRRVILFLSRFEIYTYSAPEILSGKYDGNVCLSSGQVSKGWSDKWILLYPILNK